MTLQARFSGACPECGGRWQAGDLIRSRPVGAEHVERWQHDVCPDDAPWPDGPYPMACGTCWGVHPVGACDR